MAEFFADWKCGHNVLYGCQVSSSPKKLGFFDEIYTKSVTLTLKVEGLKHDISEDLLRSFDMYFQSLPNMSSEVMDICDLVQWERILTFKKPYMLGVWLLFMLFWST